MSVWISLGGLGLSVVVMVGGWLLVWQKLRDHVEGLERRVAGMESRWDREGWAVAIAEIRVDIRWIKERIGERLKAEG